MLSKTIPISCFISFSLTTLSLPKAKILPASFSSILRIRLQPHLREHQRLPARVWHLAHAGAHHHGVRLRLALPVGALRVPRAPHVRDGHDDLPHQPRAHVLLGLRGPHGVPPRPRLRPQARVAANRPARTQRAKPRAAPALSALRPRTCAPRHHAGLTRTPAVLRSRPCPRVPRNAPVALP